jgi:hypothetical protein
MTGVGKAHFQPIMDGAWLVGEFEQDQYVGRERIITWQAHYVVGWEPRVGEYRITYVDNNGSAALMRGWIEGPRFIIETLGEAVVQSRMAWERLADGQVAWRNDCSINGGPWFLVEEYLCRPL